MTDTKTMTLTEFLLARIAEDEAEARKWQEREVRWPSRRVQAECEAKRRIVGIFGGRSWQVNGRTLPGANEVLHILAATYADHPDYRDEWAV